MDLVFICGDAATGKMTVGQELAKETGLRLFHNHITIEPVIEVFGYYSARITNKLRNIFFEEFAQSALKGMIFTMMYDFNNETEQLYILNIIKIFEKYNDELHIYFIELNADLETRIERNKTENRLNNKPSKRDIEESEIRLIKDSENGRFISKPNEVEELFPQLTGYIRLINNNLTVNEQVNKILEKFNIES